MHQIGFIRAPMKFAFLKNVFDMKNLFIYALCLCATCYLFGGSV